MRNRLFIFTVITLIVVSSGFLKTGDVKRIDAKMKMAADLLLNPAEAKEGFKLLIEAIVMAAPETDFPTDFEKKISEAKDLFESTSIFSPEGVALLNESYLLINNGENYQMPTSISSIHEAVEYARNQINAARKSMQQGQADECVKILTEIAIMVVTPMHKAL